MTLKMPDTPLLQPEKPQIKLLIATPMYGGMCTGEYTRSLMGVEPVMGSVGVSVSMAFIYNDSLITNARNKLATICMGHDFTHMMFIDADINFDAWDIVSMLKADKDVIAGIYPKKRINWERVEMAVKAGVPTAEIEKHAGDLVLYPINRDREQEVPVNEPLEVTGAGTGFMLIKKSVLEKLADKVDTYKDDDNGTPVYEYFFLRKDPELGKLLTEDYTFCWLCRENGIKVHVAPWVTLGHTGTYKFNGTVIPVIK